MHRTITLFIVRVFVDCIPRIESELYGRRKRRAPTVAVKDATVPKPKHAADDVCVSLSNTEHLDIIHITVWLQTYSRFQSCIHCFMGYELNANYGLPCEFLNAAYCQFSFLEHLYFSIGIQLGVPFSGQATLNDIQQKSRRITRNFKEKELMTIIEVGVASVGLWRQSLHVECATKSTLLLSDSQG
ncbi:hypothetical protein AKJ16_DCAP00816 [Drosera capensis]